MLRGSCANYHYGGVGQRCLGVMERGGGLRSFFDVYKRRRGDIQLSLLFAYIAT